MNRRAFIASSLGLLAAPLAAEGQQTRKVPRICWLAPGTVPGARESSPTWAGFIQGLRDLGHILDETIVVERRFADWQPSRLPAVAAELVALNVDAIVVVGPAGIRPAQQATQTIPIVMMGSSIDPVAEGLIASLGRPGGNITGVTAGVSPEMVGKQLELLKEALGSASRVGVLWDIRGTPLQRDWDVALMEAAGRLDVKIDRIEALAPLDLERAMSVLASQKPDAVYVTMGGATYVLRGQVAGLAARHRLPTIAYFRELPEAGGLMSYGPNIFELYRRAAWYVDRILKGAKPADLPIEQPTKFELVINLKTAKALGLTIPPSVLARADEVIE